MESSQYICYNSKLQYFQKSDMRSRLTANTLQKKLGASRGIAIPKTPEMTELLGYIGQRSCDRGSQVRVK
jgi:hypothetical protein